jgi:2-oxoglutarate/2-oxoacid ferredoxin oxidoreductase subunit alpha
VAMNPAALKANLHTVKKGGTLILNMDAFTKGNLDKAGYDADPFEDDHLNDFQLIKANITSQTEVALEEVDLDKKSKARCKNFYALGLTYFMFGRDLGPTLNWISDKFKGKDKVIDANSKALKAGFNYGDTIEASISTYSVPAAKIQPGTYRQINGNTATAWGFIQAAEAAELKLFLGSYPITPATDILHELAKHKNFGVKTFQAEDEIAGICSAIGASFGGALALTTSSGPGIALKGEAMGLATMYELPIVVVNVQRGGPSTGLPTKTEQSDLMQVMYGRNGECPMIVVAASRPNDCFEMAFEACRLALEHMTPVVLLTDGYIANGAEPWKIPDLDKRFNKINSRMIDPSKTSSEGFLAYKREDKTHVRNWAVPGMEGFEHRLGGLEKDVKTGNVSYDPDNHSDMCHIRAEKVKRVEDNIPLQTLEGEDSGDVLVLSWGGTYGATHMAVKELLEQGKKVSLCHLKYINPMPKNIGEILGNFKKVLVCELNLGQMRNIINAEFNIGAIGYNKVQGLPFKISELVEAVNRQLETL